MGPPGLALQSSASCLGLPGRLQALTAPSLAPFRRIRGAGLTVQVQVGPSNKKSEPSDDDSDFSWAHLDLNQGPTDYEAKPHTSVGELIQISITEIDEKAICLAFLCLGLHWFVIFC
jgi:hypothetical protein